MKQIRINFVTWNAVAHDKLDMDETEPQLAFVAYCMMEQGQQKIVRDELENCIVKARKELPEILDYTTVSPSKFIEQVEERSSLLIQMGYEENELGQMKATYEFSHLSFQEYLAAKAIVERWTPNSHNVNLLNALIPHMEEEHWREVLPLAAFLSGRDAQPLVEYLVKRNEEYETINEKSISHADRFQGQLGIFILHLANCIANEVPVNQNLLKKSILLIVKRKDLLDRIRMDNDYFRSSYILGTIAKSKYGSSYREIIKEQLFGCYDDRYAYEFSDAWLQLCHLENENSIQLNNILSLLESEDDQNKVTGALLMMQKAFWGSRPKQDKSSKNISLKYIKDIFSAINQMLESQNQLCVFAAAWCVAWAGYEEANVITCEIANELADRLIELWLSELSTLYNLKRAISWGLSSVCMPGIRIQKKCGLTEAIENNFSNPQNSHDKVAAVHVAIITDIWSKEEAKHRLEQDRRDLEFVVQESRLLQEMGILPLDT